MATNFSTLLRTLPAVAALALALPTAAQGLKELRLKDGRILVGQVCGKGTDYIVTTHAGSVTVAKEDVARARGHQELQAALKAKAKKAGDSVFASLNLAKVARDYGLEPEMWRLLDRALAAPEEARTAPVTRRLREFLAELEPQLLPRSVRQAPTDKRVKAMLSRCHASVKAGKLAALEELMVREPNADQALRQHARRNGSFRQRIAALSALQRRATAGNDRFVMRTTVLDRNQKVRTAAAEVCRPTITPEAVTYMAGGLAHSDPKVRVRTAEALGAVGHRAAVDLLVKAGPHAATGLRRAASDTGASRGHIAFLNQQAYIRDFDVEVAQASFIADPQIDVLQSGTVLDATVIGVTEIRKIVYAYRNSLKLLTRRDPGPDPRAWSRWLESLPKDAAPVTTGAR